MTNSMRAVVITEFGGPEVMEVREVERPEPGPKEVLVRVRGSGLNRADVIQRVGRYPAPPGSPQDIPGLEYAGTVEAKGSEVTLWEEGDRVMGILGGGGYAEYVAVHERTAVRVPAGVSTKDAGAIPEVYMTAFDALFRQMSLSEGETVLIHAVGSGVGTAGIQIASALGATSVGTSRTAAKLSRCTALGLNHAVLVEDGQFADRVLAVAPKGVDLILDTVGAAYLSQNVKVIAKQGRIVVIGLMGGVKAELALGALLAKRASIHGSVLRSRSPAEKAKLTKSFTEEMLGRFESEELKPIVDEVLPMTEIQEAHRRMDSNETFGKLVLSW